MVAVAVVAVAIGATVAVIVSRGSSGPTAYLTASASQVEFITWQQTGRRRNGLCGGQWHRYRVMLRTGPGNPPAPVPHIH